MKDYILAALMVIAVLSPVGIAIYKADGSWLWLTFLMICIIAPMGDDPVKKEQA